MVDNEKHPTHRKGPEIAQNGAVDGLWSACFLGSWAPLAAMNNCMARIMHLIVSLWSIQHKISLKATSANVFAWRQPFQAIPPLSYRFSILMLPYKAQQFFLSIVACKCMGFTCSCCFLSLAFSSIRCATSSSNSFVYACHTASKQNDATNTFKSNVI